MRAALITLLVSIVCASGASAGGEIYGTVTTVNGDEYTGAIRWDKNENFWDDVIDVTKTDRVRVERHNGVDVKFFGVQVVTTGGSGNTWTHSQFTIPFGHLSAIEPVEGKLVRLELKNGDVIEVREGADMGQHMRGVMIDADEGEVKLDWDDIGRVDFASGPGDRDAERLYGKVETTIGEFTGYIVWDRDEALAEDILDGERDGRDREIPFANIQDIEKIGSRGSRVTLKSGKVFDLTGSNDVDDDNRGIAVTIADLGKVKVDWSQFRRVRFMDPPSSLQYGDFDGGHALRGVLTTRDGDTWTGEIVWDKDERYTWEAVDGDIKGVEFEILFQHIARIDRESQKSATVKLNDGLEFRLRNSNDVDHTNKGIVIHTEDGEEIEVGWEDFESVVFSGG